MVDKFTQRLRSERGSVIPIVVVLMFSMLGMAAFAIDVGSWYQAKRQAQSAADAAALAGMQDLPNNPTTATTDATTYANATFNTATPTVTTPYNSDSGQIHVTVTKTVPSILGSILGINSVTVTASATAKVNGSLQPAAVFAYNSSCATTAGIQDSGNNDAINGAVHSNGYLNVSGNDTFGNTTYGGPSNCGDSITGSHDTFGGSGPTVDRTLETWPTDYSKSPPSCTYSGSSFTWSSSGATIPSGVYCATGKITINGNNVSGNVTLKAASFDLSGNNLSLTPYAQGLAVWQTGSTNLNISGNNIGGGAVFAPSAEIDITANNISMTGFFEGLNVNLSGNNITLTGNGPTFSGGLGAGYLTQ